MSGATVLEGIELNTVTDPNWRIVNVADDSGDGLADLFWRNIADGRNVIWALEGPMIVGVGVPPAVSDLNWRVVGQAPDESIPSLACTIQNEAPRNANNHTLAPDDPSALGGQIIDSKRVQVLLGVMFPKQNQ